MTNVPEKIAQKYSIKRKRKLIVRDWFFFVVWYIRLRKILKGVYSRETMESFLLFNPRYTGVLEAFIENPNMNPKELRELLETNQEWSRDKVMDAKIRVESLNLCVYKD